MKIRNSRELESHNRPFVILVCCLVALMVSFAGGAVLASFLMGPSEKLHGQAGARIERHADRNAGEQLLPDTRSNQAFRYGPDVNHGRGDTPVNYSQQALREAKTRKPAIVQRPTSREPRRIDIAVRPDN